MPIFTLQLVSACSALLSSILLTIPVLGFLGCEWLQCLAVFLTHSQFLSLALECEWLQCLAKFLVC
jgi:hypothetical protein